MKKLVVIVLALVLVVAGVVLFLPGGSGPALANAATLAVLHGDVDAQKSGAEFGPALDGDVFATGDVVRANAAGLAVLTFFEGSTISVEPGSQVKVTSLAHTAGDGIQTTIEMPVGRIWASVTPFKTPDSRFEIKTPSTTAAVRGTAFVIQVAADGTTTIETTEGQVIAQAQGQSQTIGANQRNTTPPGGPPGAPVPQPPAPRLRLATQTAGLGFVVIDPKGHVCGATGGALQRQAPKCDVVLGSETVTFGEVETGTYTLLATASTAVAQSNIAITGGSGDKVDFTQTFNTSVGQGELVKTTFNLTVGGGGVLSASALTPVERVVTTCGGELRGRAFTGDPNQSQQALLSYAAQNKGQPAALILTNAEITAYARTQAAKFQGVALSNVNVTIDAAGVRASATASMGLSFTAGARIIGTARGNKLVLKVADFQGVPGPLTGQLRSTLDQQLANVDFPLNVERVVFRPGCLAIFGTTR